MDSALHLRVAELHNERAPKIPGKFAKNHQTGRKYREIHKIQQKLAQGMLLASPFCLVRIPNIKGCVLWFDKNTGFEAWQICLDKDSPNKCRFIWLLTSLRSFDHLTIHMNTAHVTHLWLKKTNFSTPRPKASKKKTNHHNHKAPNQHPNFTLNKNQQAAQPGVSHTQKCPPILVLPWDRPGFGEEGEAFRDRAEIPRFPLGLRDLGSSEIRPKAPKTKSLLRLDVCISPLFTL